MNLTIDGFTPCLEEKKKKKIVDTSYSPVSQPELKTLKKWKFKQKSLGTDNLEIFKLTVTGDERIQGLIALQNIPSDKAVYVKIAESAPHNIGITKEFKGVEGICLLQLSIVLSNQVMMDLYIWMPKIFAL